MADRGRPRSFDKQKALSRAMDVFWTKGYEGASLADLTTAMGIASPSLYAAFGSKEALFRQTLDHYTKTEGLEIWRVVEHAPTAYAAVSGFLLDTARVFTRPERPSGCLIVLSALHATEASETVRRELTRMRRQSIEILAARLQQGVEAGELGHGVDVRALASFFITVQQGMSIQARDGATREQLEAVAMAALGAWPTSSQPRAGGTLKRAGAPKRALRRR